MTKILKLKIIFTLILYVIDKNVEARQWRI